MFEHRNEIESDARQYAQMNFQKEMLLRFWIDGHGSYAVSNNSPSSGHQSAAEERASTSRAMLSQKRLV